MSSQKVRYIFGYTLWGLSRERLLVFMWIVNFIHSYFFSSHQKILGNVSEDSLPLAHKVYLLLVQFNSREIIENKKILFQINDWKAEPFPSQGLLCVL